MTDTAASRKNRDDARAAFLALAAAPEGDRQHCPSSEEIAAFVENPPHGEERQRMLRHLGECSSCYEEWLYLHQHIHEKNRRQWAGNVTRFLNSRKTLAWAGSLMGIAAAVVVFLQLRTNYVGLKQVETTVPRTADERTMDRLPAPLEESENGFEKTELPLQKRRQEPARKPAAGQQQFSLEESSGASQVSEQKTEELTTPEASRSATAAQKPPAVSSRADMSAESADGIGEEPAFEEKLRDGCAAARWEKIFWREMEAEIVQEGNLNEAMTNSRPFQQLAQLVALAAESGGNEKMCREMMAILERIRYE